MKRKLIAIMILLSFALPFVVMGCDDEVEVHRENNPAPRTVQQQEVVVP